jgi:hypothetical protein
MAEMTNNIGSPLAVLKRWGRRILNRGGQTMDLAEYRRRVNELPTTVNWRRKWESMEPEQRWAFIEQQIEAEKWAEELMDFFRCPEWRAECEARKAAEAEERRQQSVARQAAYQAQLAARRRIESLPADCWGKRLVWFRRCDLPCVEVHVVKPDAIPELAGKIAERDLFRDLGAGRLERFGPQPPLGLVAIVDVDRGDPIADSPALTREFRVWQRQEEQRGKPPHDEIARLQGRLEQLEAAR